MTDSLATRGVRVVSGSAHALVSAVENSAPDAVMEEAIREVDRALDEVRAELGRALAHRHRSRVRLSEEHERHADLAEKLQLALQQGREDLALAAIAQQLDSEPARPRGVRRSPFIPGT